MKAARARTPGPQVVSDRVDEQQVGDAELLVYEGMSPRWPSLPSLPPLPCSLLTADLQGRKDITLSSDTSRVIMHTTGFEVDEVVEA